MYFTVNDDIESFVSKLSFRNDHTNILVGTIKTIPEFEICINVAKKTGYIYLIGKKSSNVITFILRLLYASLTLASIFFDDRNTRNIFLLTGLIFLVCDGIIYYITYLRMFIWIKSNNAHRISKRRYESS